MEVSMKKENFFSAKRITGLAVLLALVIVLQAVGGSVAIGAVTLNFTLIPIVLGAILYGALAGAILGFACGVVVWIQVIMGLSPFYTIIWTETPFMATLTCIVKTVVAGYVCGIVYKWLSKKNDYLALFVASGVVPVINTALFIVGCLLMNDSISAFQAQIGDTSVNILVFILVGLVTFNFFIELALNMVATPAIRTVLGVVTGKLSSKKKFFDDEDEGGRYATKTRNDGEEGKEI